MITMDNIGSTNAHYKNISAISVSILLVIFQAYLMLILGGFDIFNFSMLQDDIIRYIVQILVQLVAFSVLYAVIYAIVRKIYCLKWIRENKKIWIKGFWLHIHVKKEIRVGTVEIRQNFNTINAKGHNIRPKTAESETPPKETTWFYTLCKVVDDDSARDFIGCYQASNISQQTTKDGIHVMQIIGCDSKTGFANRMVGVFRDTVRISPDSVVDIGNQAGQLYFFRISEALRQYLFDGSGFRYDKRSFLHENAEFADEPYVIELKKHLKNSGARQAAPAVREELLV